VYVTVSDLKNGTGDNARQENAALQNAAPDCKCEKCRTSNPVCNGGKCGTGKCGKRHCMENLQSTKYSSHRVLIVAIVATVRLYTCYHFAFRLVSYVQKTEYATIPKGRDFVYADANMSERALGVHTYSVFSIAFHTFTSAKKDMQSSLFVSLPFC